ncbi:MAG: phage tail protein [Ignavibacteriae bacterium]|nr:MAG: phage tail protein [Ignavibacteriota bacterium]
MSQINESAIKTPGVYVNEIPSFPPSVAQVATAIPVFIGYTEKAAKNGRDVTNQAVRISSLVQYVQYFGEAFDNLEAQVVLNNDNSVSQINITPKYQMFNAIQMFFSHGGSNCYIISVGSYKSDGSADITDFIKTGFIRCFEVLKKEDEPTLIVIPDAVMLDENDYNSVITAALRQCGELQDRFAILDILNGDKERTYDADDIITKFRSGTGGSNLSYGAAYYPWLRSNLQYSINYQNIKLQKPGGNEVEFNSIISGNNYITQLDKIIEDEKAIDEWYSVNVVAEMPNTISKDDLISRVEKISTLLKDFITPEFTIQNTDSATDNGLTVKKIHFEYTKAGTDSEYTAIEKLLRELYLIDISYPIPTDNPIALGKCNPNDFSDYQLTGITPNTSIYGTPTSNEEAVKNIIARLKSLYDSVIIFLNNFRSEINNLMDSIELQFVSSSSVYSNIKRAIKNEGIVVPPSGAITGIYASVDGTRGVWKAPANISLNNVIEPMVNIDESMQEDLNVDTNAGKSINAIRTFTGKGIFVWGARTLAGNDAEWRFINVRRFFIMVEESCKKATAQFVFEPNDANTWIKIRAMIENYLTNLWRLGALAGAKPEHAFYVKCGLGQTMTAQDILEGKLIVEIGMAAVRPAEFIILRFSHKMQES